MNAVFRYSVNHLFMTTTIGVDPGYAQEKFYQRVLNKDCQRVQQRFQEAEQKGVRVKKSQSSIEVFETNYLVNLFIFFNI